MKTAPADLTTLAGLADVYRMQAAAADAALEARNELAVRIYEAGGINSRDLGAVMGLSHAAVMNIINKYR